MRVLGIDFETTGLSTKEDRITEAGIVLWDVENKRPILMESVFLYDDSYPLITEEITRLTGITRDLLLEFGTAPRWYLERISEICRRHRVEYLVAHNGISFDIPILHAELDRCGLDVKELRSIPLIDTRYHLPHTDKPDSTKLKYMAADAGFINPFSHRAAFDVLTMMKLFSQYDIQDILNEKNEPRIIVRAIVPGPWEDGGVGKDKAKSFGFRWEEIDGVKYPKCWVKQIKKCDLESTKESLVGYEVVQLA